MGLSIADVERDTGLSKDTLRVWERRYGFPQPQRDALGERSYPQEQLERLRLIKRLMDAGHRPGRLVPRSMEELLALSQAGTATPAARQAATTATPLAQELDALVALVRGHEVSALQQALAMSQAHHGLSAYVTEVVAPLACKVGEAWVRGELRIFEEHLFTECVQGALHTALGGLSPAAGRPRVLLATLPGEPHALGLLMAQTLLALQGCTCLSLGPQVPLDDLAAAATAWRADIVALSVSGCLKPRPVLNSLEQLRSRLSARMTLWVGGAAPMLSRRQLPGVVRVAGLEAIGNELARWQETTR
jgi:DNA-binding transcriptional MerR regulator/methylmalonyl-CoA mutase cobalamin-binding subunit